MWKSSWSPTGGGVRALLKGPDSHAEQVEELVAKGVHFAACADSLDMLEICGDALLESVEIVSSV